MSAQNMATNLGNQYKRLAERGKYALLYLRLSHLSNDEWKTTFGEIEAILGFSLPLSARLYRPWWANQSRGNGHSQALAWGEAGWKTAEIDMEGETVVFRRKNTEKSETVLKPRRSIDEIWPARDFGPWPEGLSLRREDIYEDRA